LKALFDFGTEAQSGGIEHTPATTYAVKFAAIGK